MSSMSSSHVLVHPKYDEFMGRHGSRLTAAERRMEELEERLRMLEQSSPSPMSAPPAPTTLAAPSSPSFAPASPDTGPLPNPASSKPLAQRPWISRGMALWTFLVKRVRRAEAT